MMEVKRSRHVITFRDSDVGPYSDALQVASEAIQARLDTLVPDGRLVEAMDESGEIAQLVIAHGYINSLFVAFREQR